MVPVEENEDDFYDPDEAEKSFVDRDGNSLLIICPKCQRENYALNVYSAICTWCGLKCENQNNLTST